MIRQYLYLIQGIPRMIESRRTLAGTGCERSFPAAAAGGASINGAESV